MPTDLADVGALARNLAAAGFDARRPALFTCEGIFCYLPQARPQRCCIYLVGWDVVPWGPLRRPPASALAVLALSMREGTFRCLLPACRWQKALCCLSGGPPVFVSSQCGPAHELGISLLGNGSCRASPLIAVNRTLFVTF